MAEWDEIVPAYEIARFARGAFSQARKKANELKAHYLSNGISQQSVKKAVSEIEPDLVFDGRKANGLAKMARQSQWGGVSVTREEVDRLETKDSA